MPTLIRITFLLLLSTTALAQRSIDFMPFEMPSDGNIVIPVAEGESLTGLAAELDAQTGGALSLAATEAKFTGEKHKTLTLFGIKPYARIDLIGVGSEPVGRLVAEEFGGLVASLNDGTSGTGVGILWSGIEHDENAGAARVAFGFRLGDYRFDRYQEDRIDPATRGNVTFYSDDANAAAEFNDDLGHIADAIWLARDLSNEPGNVMYPQSFVDRVREQFRGLDNVSIKVLDEKDLKRLGMGAHLGVGSGSARPPRLLVVEYKGGGDAPTLALAGKGITFDTGGVSLKRNDTMWMMKGDMTGAAVVTATVLAAARRGADANIVALAAMAENMPSGTAIRPGDVLTTMSGKTVEIRSTDAEGRLVLSDAVYYAQQEYKPDVLINIATLTGSVIRAIGPDYAGLFSRHDDIANDLLAAADASGELAWRLPLTDTYFEAIKSQVADVVNGGVSAAGASVGAAFIGTFVDEDQVWAHFDIAGVDYTESGSPTVPVGFTAYGVRLLDQYIRTHRE